MNALKAAIVFMAVVYGWLLALFYSVSLDGITGGLLGYVWVLSGALTLIGTAIDLSWLAIWFPFRLFRPKRYDLVPNELTDQQRAVLAEKRPTVALLMAANGEANSKADCDALTERLAKIVENLILGSCCDSKLIVAFDTDPTKAGNGCVEAERRVIFDAWQLLQSTNPGAEKLLEFREYRDKPANRRSKMGTVELFLDTEGDRFDFIMPLDADSCFPAPNREHPDTVDTLGRLVVTMLEEPRLAMIQCALRVPEYSTILGWLQHLNTRLAVSYHGPLGAAIRAPQLPSYGHNVLFRRQDLQACYQTGIPQQFLSHDYIESSLLSANGRWCIHAYNAASDETPEETTDLYLKRDFRWQRGNAQWTHFLREHPNLPIGVWYALGMGVLAYMLPLCAVVFLVSSASLLCIHGHIIHSSRPEALALVVCVLTGLWGSRLAARVGPIRRDRPKILSELIPAFAVELIVSAPLSIYSGLLFLFAPLVGTKWNIRASRQSEFNFKKAFTVAKMFVPASIVGCWLTAVIWSNIQPSFGSAIILLATISLALSPLTAVLVSMPLPGKDQPKPAAPIDGNELSVAHVNGDCPHPLRRPRGVQPAVLAAGVPEETGG